MIPKDVKTVYIKNIPVAHGEISVVLADDAEKLMRHSCQVGEQIKRAGLGVLLINCGMSDRRFRNHAREATTALEGQPFEHMPYATGTDAPKEMLIHSSVAGDLIGEMDLLSGLVAQCAIGVVIIAGWEWTSSGYRRKERLLYAIREMMRKYDVAVVIYASAKTNSQPGKCDRGGIGRLAMLAVSILNLDAADMLESVSPKPLPIVATKKDWEDAERSAQLLGSKINELGGGRWSIVDSRGMRAKGLKAPVKSTLLMKPKILTGNQAG